MRPDIDSPPTLEWAEDHVRIIDQTSLPAEVRVVELRTVDDVVDAIGRLAVRGAPAIGACGAFGVVVALDEALGAGGTASLDEVAGAIERIAEARPTAVNLRWAVDRVVAAIGSAPEGRADGSARRAAALDEATAIFDEDRAACDAIGRHGAEELVDAGTILTHCNAGRLATTGIGTALGVVYGKAMAGQPVEVYAAETRPLLQGARLTVWELSAAGIPVTLVPDSAACGLLHSGRIEAVVVGADRIAVNGDVANKVGTFSHAVAARRAGVPFYVAAPTSTIDPGTADGAGIVIEGRDPDEVQAPELRAAHPGPVDVWNPAFDVTPADLVTGIVTERGVLRPDFGEAIAAVLERA